MPTYFTPASARSHNGVVTAGWLNTHLRDNLNALNTPAHGTMTATQTIAASTWTPVSWDIEKADPFSFHSITTSPTYLSVPTGWGGRYKFIFGFRGTFATAAMVAVRCTEVGGSTVEFFKAPVPDGSSYGNAVLRGVYSAGDVITIDINHDDSGSVPFSFTLNWLWEGAT